MNKSSEFIKKTRAKSKLTQEQFGEKIGFSRSYVRDVESGKVEASRRFLEAMSLNFGISVDAFLSTDQILRIIDGSRGTENPNIPFLMGFTQKEIDRIEGYLKDELLKDRDTIFVDAKGCNSSARFYRAILNEPGNQPDLVQKLKNILLNNDSEIMLVIKNLSLSKMQHKGSHVRDIFKIMDDAWEASRGEDPIIMPHKEPKSCLILIDFPNFLEKNYDDIGYYTIPIYPDFLRIF